MNDVPTYPGLIIDEIRRVWSGFTSLDVIRFRNQRFDGTQSRPRTWEVWRRGHAVGMLPYDPVRDAVMMIEQFRLPALIAGIDPVLMEIPGGFRDPGESPEAALLREVDEELGVEPGRIERVGQFVLTAGGADETVTIFVGEIAAPDAGADGIVGYGGLACEAEDIRVRVLPADQALSRALAGEFANSITTIALLWLASQRPALRAKWSVR